MAQGDLADPGHKIGPFSTTLRVNDLGIISRGRDRTPERAAAAKAQIAEKALKEGKITEAQVVFEELFAGGPDNSEYTTALEGLADIYARQGRLNDALKKYREFVYPQPNQKVYTSRSNDVRVRMKFAVALHQAGQYAEALQHYRFGLKELTTRGTIMPLLPPQINEQNASSSLLPVAAHLAVTCYWFQHDNSVALEHAQEAVRLSPGYGLARLYLGLILQRVRRQVAQARPELEKARETGNAAVWAEAEKALAAQNYQERWFAENPPKPEPAAPPH